jgi:transcriptional regulator with XRE-family HTH domain
MPLLAPCQRLLHGRRIQVKRMPRRTGSATLARRIGARIRALRHDADMTQESLALECRIDKGYLSQIESGKRLPSIPTLLSVARELKVEGADLLGYDLSHPRLALLDAARRGDREAVDAALRANDLT